VFPALQGVGLMDITFSCERCGKTYAAPPEYAGKSIKCKKCARTVAIPRQPASASIPSSSLIPVLQPNPTPPASRRKNAPKNNSGRAKSKSRRSAARSRGPQSEADFETHAVDEPEQIPLSGDDVVDDAGGARLVQPILQRHVAPAWSEPPPKNPKRAAASKPRDLTTKAVAGGTIGLISVLFICLRLLRIVGGVGRAVTGDDPAALQRPIPVLSPADLPKAAPLVFPDLGPATPLDRGIVRHEVQLGPRYAGPNTAPGHCGKLWIYLPRGNHEARSLACVLITGAGSTLLAGMDLGEGDVAEHLPYARAGFAVMAYELDGVVPDQEKANDQEVLQGMKSYLAARAGLINAQNALEYLLEKVPQVDPERLYAAGHSSAGTMSLLFAENEPRLKGCIAFAPAVDVNARLRSQNSRTVDELIKAGFGDFFDRYNPRRHEQDLNRPVFLFHAQDDSNVPVSESSGLADRLRQAGKDVTLEIVPTGGHYDSMIQQGIPKAIAWLKRH
jgi:dienelactone hydrolase